MNLPNKLTLARIFMIPLFLIFFFMEVIPYNYFWAFLVFVLASLTDMLDGQIARKRGLITDFGKLMDPLADKLLVTAALCCLLPNFGIFGIVSLVIILSREFLVTSVRLIAAGKGEVLAADNWGKVKTVTQMVWICLELFRYEFLVRTYVPVVPYWVNSAVRWYSSFSTVLFAVVVLLTAASGVHYIVKNRKLFADA